MDTFPEFVQEVMDEPHARQLPAHESNRTGWETVRFQVRNEFADDEPKPAAIAVKRVELTLQARLDALERDVRRSGSRCGDGTSTDRCSPGTSPEPCT
jgi:hypothetical protein